MNPEQYPAANAQAHRVLTREEHAAQYYETYGRDPPVLKVPFQVGPVVPLSTTPGRPKPSFLSGLNGVPVNAGVIPGDTPGGKPGRPISPFQMGPNGSPIIETSAMAYAAEH